MTIPVDWTLDINTVIQVGGMLLGLIYLGRRLGGMEVKLDLLWRAWRGDGSRDPLDSRVAKLESDITNVNEWRRASMLRRKGD